MIPFLLDVTLEPLFCCNDEGPCEGRAYKTCLRGMVPTFTLLLPGLGREGEEEAVEGEEDVEEDLGRERSAVVGVDLAVGVVRNAELEFVAVFAVTDGDDVVGFFCSGFFKPEPALRILMNGPAADGVSGLDGTIRVTGGKGRSGNSDKGT